MPGGIVTASGVATANGIAFLVLLGITITGAREPAGLALLIACRLRWRWTRRRASIA